MGQSSYLHRLWVTIGAAILGVFVSGSARAAFAFNDDSWEGTQGLYALARSVSGANRVKLVASVDYSQLTPADALLIVHPMVPLDSGSLSAFIQAGGRVAILDDFGQAESFLERFSIRRLTAPANPTDTLRNNPNLPIAVPVENRPGANAPERHPIVKDVDRVVLNHPTILTNPGLTAVLELRSKTEPPQPIAVTGVVGTTNPGRLLAMSDPSSVMNLMLRYPGNRHFALGLVRYLTEDDHRAGKGQLYLVANRFEQTGRYGKGGGLIADARQRIEELLQELRHGLPKSLLVLLVAITLLGVVRWAYRHAVRPGSLHQPRFLRAIPLTAHAGWPGRAASLMAPKAHPAFALLELRGAFRERLIGLLSADFGATSQGLVQAAKQRRLLEAGPLAQLERYLAELDSIERAVAERRSMRIRKATVTRLLYQGLDILDRLSQVERTRREPSPASK